MEKRPVRAQAEDGCASFFSCTEPPRATRSNASKQSSAMLKAHQHLTICLIFNQPIPYGRSSANSLIRLLRIFIFLFICRRTFAHQSVITDVHLDLMDPQRLGTHALRQPHP